MKWVGGHLFPQLHQASDLNSFIQFVYQNQKVDNGGDADTGDHGTDGADADADAALLLLLLMMMLPLLPILLMILSINAANDTVNVGEEEPKKESLCPRKPKILPMSVSASRQPTIIETAPIPTYPA